MQFPFFAKDCLGLGQCTIRNKKMVKELLLQKESRKSLSSYKRNLSDSSTRQQEVNSSEVMVDVFEILLMSFLNFWLFITVLKLVP